MKTSSVYIPLLAIGPMFFLFTACVRESKPDRADTTSVPTFVVTNSVPLAADADLLQGVPLGAALTNKESAASDKAWMDLLVAMRPPPLPAEWLSNPPSEDIRKEHQKKVADSVAKTADLAREFYTKYPTDERAAEAREREEHLLNVALELGNTNVTARVVELEESLLKDPKLPEDERLQLRFRQVQRAANKAGGTDIKVFLTEAEKGAREVQKEFPHRPEVGGFLLSVAEHWARQDNLPKARTLAGEVTNSADADFKAAAESLMRKINRVGKPLDIKFTALNGTNVDLQSMRGKVVLVDFWATWCEPCVEELPKMKEVYQRLHPKGFEVIGISLDMKKESLLEMIAKEGIPWPQFFDESGEANRFADEFEALPLPVLWLVDKKGNLRHLSAREDLAGKVEKLLAEP